VFISLSGTNKNVAGHLSKMGGQTINEDAKKKENNSGGGNVGGKFVEGKDEKKGCPRRAAFLGGQHRGGGGGGDSWGKKISHTKTLDDKKGEK